jgi:6-phosphogluconolactonase
MLQHTRSAPPRAAAGSTCCRTVTSSSSSKRSRGSVAARAAGGVPAAGPKPVLLNVIPQSQWADGVPPVMGAHLMASGVVAPISVSKGAGVDVPPHIFQYPDAECDIQVQLFVTPAAASNGLSKAVLDAAAAAIKARGAFTLVLSGGSLISSVEPLAAAKGVDWNKWHVFFVDERNVPHSSADSTYKAAQEALLSRVPIPAAQVHAIAEGLPVAAAATNYEGRILGLSPDILPRDASALPRFDMVLLGVGPDGHVASLFPNTAATAATSGIVLPVTRSPKPPAERITMTMAVINNAAHVLVVALGEGKAEIVQRVLECQSLPGALPAQLVRPKSGVKWVLDVMAAQHLDISNWDNSKSFPRSN